MPNRKPRVLVLLSGGLDSSLTAAYLKRLGHVLHALFIDRGQKNLEKELQATKRVCEILGISTLYQASFSLEGIRKLLTPEVLRERGIPARNLILTSIATPYADLLGCRMIATGNLTSDGFPDCNPRFRKRFSRVASLVSGRDVSVVSPFADWEKWDKGDEIKWGVENGYEELIKETWTCWESGVKHCGSCNACVDRIHGFIKAGIPDSTEYFFPLATAKNQSKVVAVALDKA